MRAGSVDDEIKGKRWYSYGMKAIWKGSITLALVSIPVKVYGATHHRGISFRLLHRPCSTPLRYEKFCPTCNREVGREEIVHGYEYEKGRFVTITDEELEKVAIKTSKAIEILKFVDPREVEPTFYDRAFYLEPQEGGERAYTLLREIMRMTDKVGLAKIAMREREHIGVIRIWGKTLVLHTLYYADEVMRPEALHIPEGIRLEEEELSLARELVKHFTGPFDIERYHDEFRESLMELIRAKIEGKEIKVPPKREVEKVVSLMEALKKSLEKKAV